MIIAHGGGADLPAILELEALGFEAAERWSEQAWADELNADDHCVLTRLDPDAQVVGVAALSCVAETADLLRIVVRPDARGQGIGASLLRAGMEWAQAVGAERMMLEVSPENEAAIRLYHRYDFEAVTTRRDYYGPDRPALVMVRDFDLEVMTA